MINLEMRNLNSITDIIDNIMGRAQQNRFSEHFLNKMGDLTIYSEDFSFKQADQVFSIILISISHVDKDTKIINK